MNDYEFTFMQDVKEKKLVATGARHRATRGKKSFAVHNQSDYLTKKEVRAMSGAVHEFNLNKPMRWNQYQLLENSSKELYLKSLVEEYGVKAPGIAKMFGVSGATARNELAKYGLVGKQGVRQSKGATTRWERFLSGDESQPDTEAPINKPEPVYDTAAVYEPKQAQEQGASWYAKMELVGTSKERVITDLCAIIDRVEGYGKLYKITLEVE